MFLAGNSPANGSGGTSTTALIETKPKRAALSPAEREQRRRIRDEKQRIADAKMTAFYNDEDVEKLVEFRRHWGSELPPGAERVTLMVMIEGLHGDCHSLLDRVVMLPEGGIDRVMREMVSLADRHDVCTKSTAANRTEKPAPKRGTVKLRSGKLPAQVSESIDAVKGDLLHRVLGNRCPVLLTVSVPNVDKDLIDREILKVVAITDRPDALEHACANAIEIAKSMDAQAALSDDLKY